MQLSRAAIVLFVLIGVSAAKAQESADVAAILVEPGFPAAGAPSTPDILATIVRRAGFQARIVSAEQVADPAVLDPARVRLLVLPHARVFPAEGRASLVQFLKGGGDLLATGGYVFEDLLRHVNGQWIRERDHLRAEFERAMSPENSLLPAGDFEEAGEIPIGEGGIGGWRRTGPQCVFVAEEAHEGSHCGRVTLPLEATGSSAIFYQDVATQPGTSYRISAWMRTRGVRGQGMAYLAVYQHDEQGRMVDFRDFATARNTTDWREHRYDFTPWPNVRRLRIQAGLYNATGTMWVDDVRLGNVTGVTSTAINTSTGKPADGLEVAPEQIGIFDPSFPLKRVASLRAATGQLVLREPIDLAGEFEGWAASGVIGYDQARWIPLVEGFDRYGRRRGPVGAMIMNYGGFYAGSCWAYFGIENQDLFADPESAAARGLQQVAGFLRRKLFLRNLATDQRLYRAGEKIIASVVVDNRGRHDQTVAVCFTLEPEDGQSDASAEVKYEALTARPGTSRRVEVAFTAPDRGAALERITATLQRTGEEEEDLDVMTTGVVLQQPASVAAAPPLRFSENYFTLGGRPLFLFGSDDYSRIYRSASENPLTWAEELDAARDMGLNLYENLQYVNRGHRMSEDDWRTFRAMAQLVAARGMVFMPGMLIGHNVAIGDAALDEESALCREYAKRLGDVPALLYYINGDYQMRLEERPEAVKTLWNRWLAERYGGPEKLRAAWRVEKVGKWGEMPFPPDSSQRWDDVAAVDRWRFLHWLMLRWNQAHVAAVREHDREHPITSEYYQFAFAGMDLPLTIDGQDVSNIGYFDRPGEDLDGLPLKIRFNDLRARGKGVSLGEYGVKTHPAWAVENGASGYHIVRTEDEQKQLFLAVAHYGLGLGAAKIQNWCLRDDQARMFPWGMFYPNQVIPKDVAYVHRNQSLLWRRFAPRYVPPRVTVCLADQLRQGNSDGLGAEVAYRTFTELLGLHYDFNTINDQHLDQLPNETTVLVYPSPMAIEDESFSRLLSWVERGGVLLVTGDFSYDADRQRTRTDRLKKLAGVEFVVENYANIHRSTGSDAVIDPTYAPLAGHAVRPCIRVRPSGAEVLATAGGMPLLVRHHLGQGKVYYLTDPVELADEPGDAVLRRKLYGAVLQAVEERPVAITPDEPWLHVMAQPTTQGTVHVVHNTKPAPGREDAILPTAAGEIRLAVRNRYPALAAVTAAGNLVAASADGNVSCADQTVLRGEGIKAVLSLDGQDLRRSQAVLVGPFEPGRLELASRTGKPVALVGDIHRGRWRTLERVPLTAERPAIDIDGDRATCLILIADDAQVSRWTADIERSMLHPEQVAGY